MKIFEPELVGKNVPKRIQPLAAGFLIAGELIYNYFVVAGTKSNLWYTYTLSYLAPGAIFIAALKGLDRFLDNRFLRWIGKSSYGIYIWHYLLAFLVVRFISIPSTGLKVIAYCGLSIVVGWLSTITWERYFLNLRKKVVP